MARDQNIDLRQGGALPASQRSGTNARPRTSGGDAPGPVPEDNQPGHHPDHDQDKPDLDEFRARFNHADAQEAADREAADREVLDSEARDREQHATISTLGSDHGANTAPVIDPARGPLHLPRRLLGLGARGASHAFRFGAHVAGSLADRLEREPDS